MYMILLNDIKIDTSVYSFKSYTKTGTERIIIARYVNRVFKAFYVIIYEL